MHIEYTPEAVRTLIEEHEALNFAEPTNDDLAEATDILEGVEELIAKLGRELRYPTVKPLSIIVDDPKDSPAKELAWIPVANNCTHSAGVAVFPDGTLTFAVQAEGGRPDSYYFAARQAVAHALADGSAYMESGTEPGTDCSIIEQSPRLGTTEQEDPLVTLLKENGYAVAAGRTLADVDGEVLAKACRLSEEGIAHLFATEAGDGTGHGTGHGIVLAMAGSTAGDRRRAVEKLPTLPARSYSTRSYSVLGDYVAPGDHYSEQGGFGQTVKETPKPKEHLLEAAAERFKASRFVRPSFEKPLDAEAIRQRVRKVALVRAAVRDALAVNTADAHELVRRAAAVHIIARYFSRKMVRRALAAEKPWDSKAERKRMAKRGFELRQEIAGARRNRYGMPARFAMIAARKLDAWRVAGVDPRDPLARKEWEERGANPEAHWTTTPESRTSIEGRRKSGRSSYDTARAVYLQRCPDLEHKLLHLLRRDGVKAEAKFLSRHSGLAAGATNPEGALRTALRALAGSGKVRRVRSHKTGEVFLTATEPLDETGYRRSLNGLIRDERFGIVNPWSETSPVEAEGEVGEWERGLEDLDHHEAAGLAPRRFRNTEASEQQLMAAEEVAEYSAFEEVEAVVEVAEGFAEDIA